jgi:hypothetical protein
MARDKVRGVVRPHKLEPDSILLPGVSVVTITGADGADGEPGIMGPPGEAGIDGEDGQSGVPGPQGNPGPTGLNGRDGVTVWLEPEPPDEWMIPGPPGPQGPTSAAGSTGVASLDFGAFPGASDASVAVSAPAIGAGDRPFAWIFPAATADHTADEHMVEPFEVFANAVVAGVGFTISGVNFNMLFEPLVPTSGANNVTLAGGLVKPSTAQQPTAGGIGTRIYGAWTIAWRF